MNIVFPGNINYKIFLGNQMDKSEIFLRCKRSLRFDSLVFQSCSQRKEIDQRDTSKCENCSVKLNSM